MYANLNRDVETKGGAAIHPEDREKAMELAKPLTPRSERPRATWGSLAVSLQTVRGLCPELKCVRKEGHGGSHWPS